FQPNDLQLQDMRVYADDLFRAAAVIKANCRKANPTSFAAIWAQRQKDQIGPSGLSGCELSFDRVATAVTLGRTHTEPAVGAMESIARVAISAEMTGDRTE